MYNVVILLPCTHLSTLVRSTQPFSNFNFSFAFVVIRVVPTLYIGCCRACCASRTVLASAPPVGCCGVKETAISHKGHAIQQSSPINYLLTVESVPYNTE